MRSKVTLIVIFIALSIGSLSARAEDRYYMVVFSWQSEPNLFRTAHTFASFVKVSGEGARAEDHRVEIQTISWMPRTLAVMPLRVQPEEGVNLDLPKSFKVAASIGSSVGAFPPVAVKKELHDLMVARIGQLNSGKLLYIANDARLRGAGAINCIHAISDADPTQPGLDSGLQHGDLSSAAVYRHLTKWMLPDERVPPWLVDRLGVSMKGVRPLRLAEPAKNGR